MKLEDYKISIWFFGIFAISSFVPVLQIMMAYLNGALIWTVNQFIKIPLLELAISFNLLGVLISSIFYYKSININKQILSAILVSFFMNCVILIGFEEYFVDKFWAGTPFIVTAFSIGLTLLAIDIIKHKRNKII